MKNDVIYVDNNGDIYQSIWNGEIELEYWELILIAIILAVFVCFILW